MFHEATGLINSEADAGMVLRIEQLPLGRSHRGPEGRPLNVSPARKGWVGIPIMIPSAPALSWERQRRGTHVVLNQSVAWRNRDVSGFILGPQGPAVSLLGSHEHSS